MTSEKSKDDLEKEKLLIEIQDLKKPIWKKTNLTLPILLPIAAGAVTWFLNKDYINQSLDLKKMRLEKEILEFQTTKDNLQQEITDSRIESQRLEQGIRKTQDSIKSVNYELKVRSLVIDNLTKQKVNLENSLETLDEQISLKDKSYDSLNRQLVSLNKSTDVIKTSLNLLQDSIRKSYEYIGLANYKFAVIKIGDILNAIESRFTRIRFNANYKEFDPNYTDILIISDNIKAIDRISEDIGLVKNDIFRNSWTILKGNINNWIFYEWKKSGKIKSRKSFHFEYNDIRPHASTIRNLVGQLGKD